MIVLFLVYFVVALIVICSFCTYRFGAINDTPICDHKFDSNEMRVKLLKGGDKSLRGCFDHEPSPLDLKRIKNGDILMISYDDVRSLFSSVFYASVWTHVGIIIIDPLSKEPYVLEAASYRPPYSHQVLRIPLLHWAKINQKAKHVAYLPINKEIPFESLNAAYQKFEEEEIGVENLKLGWLRFAKTNTPQTVNKESFFASEERKVKPSKKADNDWLLLSYLRDKFPDYFKDYSVPQYDYMLTCHEILISVLQDVGVFDSSLTPCSYIPSSIINKKINTIGGYEYEEPQNVSIRLLLYKYPDPPNAIRKKRLELKPNVSKKMNPEKSESGKPNHF